MPVWELRAGAINDYAPVVPSDRDDIVAGKFDIDGSPKGWMSRPCVEFDVEPRRKKQKPAADVSMFFPGTVVLSQEARAALGGFLSRFGQLLEVDLLGGNFRYLYNVTNIVVCVDGDRTTRTASGTLKKVAFDFSKVPDEPCVFKDSMTAQLHIYVNDAAKKLLGQWAHDAGLTGLEIAKPVAY